MRNAAHSDDLFKRGAVFREFSRKVVLRNEIDLKHVIIARVAHVKRNVIDARVQNKRFRAAYGQFFRRRLYAGNIGKIARHE